MSVSRRGVADVGLGLRFRKPTPGPEDELVVRFLERQVFQLPPDRRLAVFLQPALETGFPDLVAVVWREPTAAAWHHDRLALAMQDVRLLHVLGSGMWIDVGVLEQAFPRRLSDSLDRLEAAHLILRGSRKVRARAKKDIFAVEQIVSIEAKTAASGKLMLQASSNTWFSSESYALLPVRRTSAATIDRAADFGVGLLGHTDDETRWLSSSPRRAVPLSHGSWLFNEWVWRLQQTRRP